VDSREQLEQQDEQEVLVRLVLLEELVLQVHLEQWAHRDYKDFKDYKVHLVQQVSLEAQEEQERLGRQASWDQLAQQEQLEIQVAQELLDNKV
jgi:hypothetical protein